MAKKLNKSRGLKRFFFHTRLGFYTLALLAIIGFTTTINMLNSANETYESVLAARDKSPQSTEARQEKDQRREEHKQEIERKFNVDTEKLRVEYKPIGKKVLRTVNQEDAQIVIENEEELIDEIEEEIENEEGIEIDEEDGDVILKKGRIKARSRFPLSIDVATGQLTITHPDGSTKDVAILPDQAIENFLKHRKVELIAPEPKDDEDDTGTESAETKFESPQSTESAESVKETETEVEIVERNNELVYKIKGKRRIRVLGFIPAKTEVTGYVSIETGEVIDTTQPILHRLLNLISIQN